ncbi:TIGR03617 family F420-dependent LLM class oxidoreductase [Novosphingobium lentum]|uniref:TIGR03617 family F420-dependent LLM class oxidoreductase n=1 Tax=Novosphingobium lentum TaxID=145287 RepID=UPI000A022B23|nr:TIGR03617 family F420-dependent LLM class oxidoreductase [Novosphingobium lentum]
MKIATMTTSPQQAIAKSAEWEADGFDAIFTNESKHDPFVLSTLVADRTRTVEIMTYIAVALARTPMLAAASANDLNQISGGRFTLGIGSQIKPHIERRYGMPWSNPAPRMREFIQAMHAIWDCWHDGKPLKFEGRFYNHTLMTHMFTPVEHPFGRPLVGLAAVGPEMTKVAGEVADALLCHSFTSPKYLRSVTLPLVEESLATHGRDRAKFRLVGMPFIASGETDEELEKAVAHARESVAFYCSTPAYVGVLEAEGFGDIHPEMLRLSKAGQWADMGKLVSDEILNTYCVVGKPAEAAAEIERRYGGIFDMLCGYSGQGPGMPDPVMRAFKAQRTS